MYSVFLKHPFTMVVSGPTGCGKTFWIKKLIEKRETVIHPKPVKTTYFYGEYQDIFDEMKDVVFEQDLCEIDKLGSGNPELIIIDDLMLESAKSESVCNWFTKGSHHRNISIVLINQNFFCKGKENRNITLNAQYLVLFKNPRDKTIASNIARQMYPTRIKKFQSIFEIATSRPFTYLFVDLKPDTPDEIRLMTNVLGENERWITVYKIV